MHRYHDFPSVCSSKVCLEDPLHLKVQRWPAANRLSLEDARFWQRSFSSSTSRRLFIATAAIMTVDVQSSLQPVKKEDAAIDSKLGATVAVHDQAQAGPGPSTRIRFKPQRHLLEPPQPPPTDHKVEEEQAAQAAAQAAGYEGRRMRRFLQRRTVDYMGSWMRYKDKRMYSRSTFRDDYFLKPSPHFIIDVSKAWSIFLPRRLLAHLTIATFVLVVTPIAPTLCGESKRSIDCNASSRPYIYKQNQNTSQLLDMDAFIASSAYWLIFGRVHFMEWSHFQLRDHLAGLRPRCPQSRMDVYRQSSAVG